MLRRMRRSWWILALVAAFGCDTLGEFRTGEGEVYRGDIIGVNDPEACPDGVDCSFIRRGFQSGVVLDLTFDPDEQYADPGMISTTGELCGPTFTDTPLLPIPPLAHDQLGLYEFPGGGRIRNYIFVARPETGPLTGRDAIELRLNRCIDGRVAPSQDARSGRGVSLFHHVHVLNVLDVGQHLRQQLT